MVEKKLPRNAAPSRGSGPVRKAAAGKAAAGKASPRPSLNGIYPPPLKKRTLALVDAIERAADPLTHATPFADVVVELTEAGMGYFFLSPLEMAKAGFVVRQGAELGMSGALRVMAPVIRTLVGRLEPDQLRVVARFVRAILD